MNVIKEKGPHKIARKLRRKQILLFKHEPNSSIRFTSKTTNYLFIANGGLLSGLSRELLLELCDHLAHDVLMLDNRDYCIITSKDLDTSSFIRERLNGACVQEECQRRDITHMLNPAVASGLPLRLYVGYVENIPESLAPQYPVTLPALPPGLILKNDYITVEEEQSFLTLFGSDESRGRIPGQVVSESSDRRKVYSEAETPQFMPPEAKLKHRRVKHYGYEFLYGSNTVDAEKPLQGGLPIECRAVLERIISNGFVSALPDQLTINEYPPGAGIPPHVDTHSAFEDGIISLTLGSQCVMDFMHPGGHSVSVFLPQRSLLVMTGESRYVWSHGIAARKFDVVHTKMLGYQPFPSCADVGLGSLTGPLQDPSNFTTILPRGVRISLTFRKVIFAMQEVKKVDVKK